MYLGKFKCNNDEAWKTPTTDFDHWGNMHLTPLQYLAGYYHINDGYLVDTKNK